MLKIYQNVYIMKYSFKFERIVIAVLILFSCIGCSDELDTETFDNSSLVTVKFQGTPSAFNKVNLEIIEVQLRVLEDASSPDAWVSLPTSNTGVFDVATITGNTALSLVDFEEVPSEFIYNIRVVFGDRNRVVKDNIEYTVAFDSQFDNAASNIVEKHLESNTVYEFTLIFDTDRSIKMNADDSVNISPNMTTNLSLYNLF